MTGKRTGIDFSKHELIVSQSIDSIIHYLKKPDTICQSIKFINAFGVMIVLGDFGYWLFNRPYVPGPKEYVSDSYWLEKCEMEGEEFDPEETQKELQEGIDGGLKDYGYEGEKLKEAISFYEDCLRYADSEWEYVAYAYGPDQPGFMASEEIPHCKKTKQWLRIVFDGFEEICRRLKEEENSKIQ